MKQLANFLDEISYKLRGSRAANRVIGVIMIIAILIPVGLITNPYGSISLVTESSWQLVFIGVVCVAIAMIFVDIFTVYFGLKISQDPTNPLSKYASLSAVSIILFVSMFYILIGWMAAQDLIDPNAVMSYNGNCNVIKTTILTDSKPTYQLQLVQTGFRINTTSQVYDQFNSGISASPQSGNKCNQQIEVKKLTNTGLILQLQGTGRE